MIEIQNLSKYYKDFPAVDQVDMTVKDGEITILLGRNGAGKSTTIKSIAGLLSHTGQILIDGMVNTTVEAKRRLGYIPETPSLYGTLTVKEHVHFIGRAYGIDDYMDYADELLERFDMEDKKEKLARELSKGMSQKLSMILALMTKPHAILVDEPMIGLDPEAIENVLGTLKILKEEGNSILISTHIIDIVTEIWDRAFIMEKGRIVRQVVKTELEECGESLKTLFFQVTGGDSHERS